MMTFISSSVTPDALLFALWSLVFWLGVRILKRGLAFGPALALFLLVGVAVATKATSYALLPAALLVLAVGAMRARRRARPHVAAIVVASLLAFVLPAGGWLATAAVLDRPAVNKVSASGVRPTPTITSFNPRELASYLWQFYFPRLPFQHKFSGLQNLPSYNVWLKGSWGSFGWLEVKFPGFVYIALGLFSLFVLAAAGVAVARLESIDWAVAAFFAVAVLTLLVGLHWTEFRTLVGSSTPFNQGRYLLPLIALAGSATAAALSLLPAPRRGLGVASLFGGLLVLQIFSFAIVGGRFYA